MSDMLTTSLFRRHGGRSGSSPRSTLRYPGTSLPISPPRLYSISPLGRQLLLPPHHRNRSTGASGPSPSLPHPLRPMRLAHIHLRSLNARTATPPSLVPGRRGELAGRRPSSHLLRQSPGVRRHAAGLLTSGQRRPWSQRTIPQPRRHRQSRPSFSSDRRP